MTNNISQSQKATEKVEAQSNITRKRRGAISSEPLGDKPATPLPNIPKTAETQQRLQQALSNNIMFSHLEEEERNIVFLAMVEVLYKAGDIIIKQGDEGDLFYVIDQGICDIYVSANGGSPTLVMEVFEGGSFGELALIYGSPRAATVIARTDVRLWALNGTIYRRILMDQTIKKRRLYEEFLEKVSILRHIDKYERVSLADALEPVSFQDGEVIVRQGDPGDRFYIIVEGKVIVTQETTPGDPSTSQVVAELFPSDYFGEIALLTDRPRAATVTSIGYTKCVELDRQRFNRLCGPIDQMLRRNMETYNQYIKRANSPTLTSQKY